MKIRIKIFLTVFFSSLLIFSLLVAYVMFDYSTDYLNYAKKQITDYNSHAAALIKTSLEKDLSVCATIAQSFRGYDEIPAGLRDSIQQSILKNVLEANSEYISTWMTWELRFLDKNYKMNYGRRRTATTNSFGLIKFYIDTVELQGDNLSGLYYKSKQSKTDILADPYYSNYSTSNEGDSILETSIATPIIINDEFAGLVGIDMTLNRFWKLIKEIKPFDVSEMYLLSGNGTVISSSQSEKSNQDSITKLYPGLTELNTLQNIKSGKVFSHNFTDSLQTNYFASFSPVFVGNADDSWSVCLVLPQKVIEEELRSSLLKSILAGIVGILVLSFISYIVEIRISMPMRRATRLLNNLSLGMIDSSKKLQTNSKDEVSEMNKSVNKLSDKLRETANFAKQIGSGDFSAEYEAANENDVLGNALLDMQHNLKLGKEQEKIRQIEREKLSWTQDGLTELSEVLRMSNEDFQEYLLSILRYILNYFKAEQGAIFLLNKFDEEHPFLELRSAYAYDKKKVLETNIEIGESLVGRCFQEKETIYMTNIPEGYTFVSSGLGGHQPKCLFLMPLIFEDEALGVVEIAAFREFEDFEIEFLKVVGERIASSISVMEKNFQTQTFLEQYKEKSSELENIEVVLEENKKELTATKQIAENRELENTIITDAISSFASLAWLNLKGRVINVKDNYFAELGLSQIDMIKQKQSTLIEIQQKYTKKFKTLWENLLEGKEGALEVSYTLNNKVIEVFEIYKPIKNTEGKTTKILNITLDYSRHKPKI